MKEQSVFIINEFYLPEVLTMNKNRIILHDVLLRLKEMDAYTYISTGIHGDTFTPIYKNFCVHHQLNWTYDIHEECKKKFINFKHYLVAKNFLHKHIVGHNVTSKNNKLNNYRVIKYPVMKIDPSTIKEIERFPTRKMVKVVVDYDTIAKTPVYNIYKYKDMETSNHVFIAERIFNEDKQKNGKCEYEWLELRELIYTGRYPGVSKSGLEYTITTSPVDINDTPSETHISHLSKKEYKDLVEVVTGADLNYKERQELYKKCESEGYIYSLLGSINGCNIARQLFYNINVNIIGEKDNYYMVNMNYYENETGRLYQKGYSMQTINKECRDAFLSEYHEVDIKGASVSILLGYALRRFPDKAKEEWLPCMWSFTSNPDKFRNALWEDMKKYDPTVTIDYIKNCCNAVAFGCGISTKRIITSIKYNKKNHAFTKFEGYTLKELPLYMAEHPMIIALFSDIKAVAGLLMDANEVKEKSTEKKKVYKNLTGKEFSIKNTRTEFGSILAHFYHAIEAEVLRTIYGMKYHGDYVSNHTGLLLHDGIYIEKSFIKNTKDFLYRLRNYILRDTLGYDLIFSIK